MSSPRQILPGNYWFFTRRTLLQMFMMRPEPAVNQIFEFCLGHSANEYDVELIAWEALSNHYHLVAFDPAANIPAFLQYLDRLLAAVFNHHLGRRENFWSSDEPCLTLLATEADVMEKVVYTLGNAVRANLVDTVAEWPGSSSLRFLDGERRSITRPSAYFSPKKSVLPKAVELAIHQPHGSRKKESFAEWADAIRNRITRLEKAAASARAAEPNAHTLGVMAVLDTPPMGRPLLEDTDAPPKPKLRPRLACKEPVERRERLKKRKTFQFQHKNARKQLAEGQTGVVFPEGTYRLPPGCVIGKCPPMPVELERHINRIPCDEPVPTASPDESKKRK